MKYSIQYKPFLLSDSVMVFVPANAQQQALTDAQDIANYQYMLAETPPIIKHKKIKS